MKAGDMTDKKHILTKTRTVSYFLRLGYVLFHVLSAMFLFYSGFSGKVYKICTANGTWKTEENSSTVWQDKSECEDPGFFKNKVKICFSSNTKTKHSSIHQLTMWFTFNTGR